MRQYGANSKLLSHLALAQFGAGLLAILEAKVGRTFALGALVGALADPQEAVQSGH